MREQFLHEIGMGTAQQDLWSAIFTLHLHDKRTDAVAAADDFARDLLVAANNAFCAAKVNDDMAKFNRLHDASNDFAGTVLEFFKLALTLGIAHLLEDDLLGGLRIDTTQIHSGKRIDDKVADDGTLLQLVRLL